MADDEEQEFVACPTFTEVWEGYYFGTGPEGTGYYWDYVAAGTTKPAAKPKQSAKASNSDDLLAPGLAGDVQAASGSAAAADKIKKAKKAQDPFFRKGGANASAADQAALLAGLKPASKTITEALPPNCTWRVARLNVSDKACGLDMEHCEWGFHIEEVEHFPGQDLAAGDVIVGMEERSFIGLSEEQLFASFKKRCKDGMTMVVCNLEDLKKAESMKPDAQGIIKGVDAEGTTYFFNMRTGKSSWTYEEAIEHKTSVDLAAFLTGGKVASADSMKKKKKKKKKEEEKKKTLQNTVDDQFAETRQGYSEWNKDGIGGYTAALHGRYQHYTEGRKRAKLDVDITDIPK